MNLSKPLLEELFNKQIRFKIPIFQRHYVWGEQNQWKPLWDDFLNKVNERLEEKVIHPHYTGSIVLFHESTTTSTLSTYSVIDGQQRLTTFQLFIAAFREICRKKYEDESLIKEFDKLLFNEKSFGDTNYESQKFKLEPTKFNKEIFQFVVSNTYDKVEEELISPILNEYGFGWKTYRNEAKRRHRILAAYLYFYEQFDGFITDDQNNIVELIKTFLIVVKRDFQFVEIGLTQTDDPQMIFETMNGRGASLTETDLIRNYIFMRANSKGEDLDRIYTEYWDEFDDKDSDYKWHDPMSRGRLFKNRLEFLIIDYLTMKIQSDIRHDQVFYQYKSFVKNQSDFSTVEEELKELNRISLIFKRLTNPSGNTAFDKLAKRLIDIGITTIYPLVLYIESDTEIFLQDKNMMYQLLDSYVIRRFLCGYTTKNYNNVFVEFLKFLVTHKSAEAFKELLLSKTGDSNLWPSDNILSEKILERPIYRDERNKSKALCNILLEVEQFKRGSKQENVVFTNDGLTVEHILPQKWYEHWLLNDEMITKEDFELTVHAVMTEENPNGKFHKIDKRNSALHSLGNLTILTNSLNPSVSNSSFQVKKREIIRQSTLLINAYLQDKDVWDEDSIKERAKVLYESMRQIWKHG